MTYVRNIHLLLLSLPIVLSAQNRIGTGKVADLYQMHCALCHGEELDGGLGGALIGPLDHARTDAEIAAWIREGNTDLQMPAFDNVLSEPEIRSLVIYIREKRLQAEQAPPEASLDAEVTDEAGGHQFRIETVAEGLDTPWSIAFLPDGGFLVTERDGHLRIVRDGQLLPPVEGTPTVWQRGQGGLLEVALHPDYHDNGWIYLGYSEESSSGNGSTAIVRGRIRDNQWVDEEAIFNVPPEHHRSSGVHFGTRFVFKDGYLFFSIGDRGDQNSAQDLSSPNGRIHRIHDDGRIPEDNPFANNPDAFPTSWTYGNRNAQGLDANPVTGEIWETEHGPRGGDEVNLIRPGINYGWPEITYGMNYGGTPITDKTEAPGMEQPKHYWTPSIAVCGIDFYEGDRFPKWRNTLFVSGLASEELRRLVIRDQQVVSDELILKGIGRIRDVASGPDGALYLVLNRPGTIVRLLPAD
jgi:glucose/arabinose dehydrogenase